MSCRLGMALLAGLLTIACALPRQTGPVGSQTVHPVPMLVGRVELADLYGRPPARKAQATMTEVGLAATVSLIDPVTSKTVATSVSTDEGKFELNFGASFIPSANPYYLEAVKGLSSGGQQNRAGANAARVRTLIRFAGGWESITSGEVTISRASTALCVVASLRAPTSQPVNPANLIGKLRGATDFQAAGTGISETEFSSVLDLVTWALGADQDPLAAIALDVRDNSYFRVPTAHAVNSISPQGVITAGTVVTLYGAGFSATPAENIVLFQSGGRAYLASPVSTSDVAPDRSWIRVAAPAGIDESGQIFVQIGGVISAGPAYGPASSRVRDGSLTTGTDLEVQYSPLTAGNGYLKANWDPVLNAISYKVGVGTTPGGYEVKAPVDLGNVTQGTVGGLTVQAATRYFITVTPVFPWGDGPAQTSNGIRIAEAYSWDGRSEFGRDDQGGLVALRNDASGGWSKDFPAGSGWLTVYGTHTFETVDIPAGTVVHVQPFGKVDQVGEGASMADPKVSEPKDGWLALYANTIRIAGAIEADGRGYGGGGGGSGGTPAQGGDAAAAGRGGENGLSGDGGAWSGATGGQGQGGGGGGAVIGGCGGNPARGGKGGPQGGGGGGASNDQPGQDATFDGSGGAGNANNLGGGVLPFGGGPGGPDWNLVGGTDNKGGSGGAGYGAGGGGATPGCGTNPAGGGGGGGTGGKAFAGLGWAPGVNSGSGDGRGGPAGFYGPLPPLNDLSWRLGSGGAGGNGLITYGEVTGGGGGGAGGGAILLVASGELTVSGRISAVGAAGGGGGGNNGGGSGGGGGGSGGTIVLSGKTVNLTGALDARGGTAGSSRNGYAGGAGGNGGASSASGGLIKIFSKTFSGTLPPGSQALKVVTGPQP